MMIQFCNRPVVDQVYRPSSFQYGAESNEKLASIICERGFQVDQEVHHLWHDITLQKSFIHIEAECSSLATWGVTNVRRIKHLRIMDVCGFGNRTSRLSSPNGCRPG
jgi:hypothetical protein